jgi:hypothetical protein
VLTSFAIADATHVTGVTGAHAAGASDVVVTNGAGASSPLAGAFTFMGAPTLTSFSTSGGVIGDIDGGYPMAFVGTDFVIGSTTVDFGGTPGTSIVVTSSTAMTCTVPAHISGPVSVTVTTAGGTSGAQSFEYFSPAQLTLTGWWRAGYTAAPWVGTASAGGSGGRNQLTTGTDPTSGTLNSLSTASNSSGRSLVVSGTSMGTLLPAAGYFLEVLCKPASAAAPAAALYLAATPVGESSDGDIGFAYDTGGFKHFHFATAYVGPAYVAAAAGSWYSLAGRYDGTNMAFSVNGAANVTVASGTPNGPGLAASALGAFRNFSTGLGAFAGDVAEIITAAHGSVSTTDQTKIRSYLNTRYFPAGAQV